MQLTRRTFLGAAALAAIAAPAACGDGSGGGGERLRVAFPGGGSRESLDPHVVPQFVDQARAKACFDTLTGWTQSMTAEPRLAEVVEPDATGARWRIRLREATWHDGRPLTPDDVLSTFRRIADPATTASAASLFGGIDFAASRAAGPRDVEIVLGAPDFTFPLWLGAPGTEIVPAGTTGFGAPVGTGPFRFVSFEPGGTAVYVRNDAYWDGPAPSPELEFVPIDDEQARLGALLSGQVAYAHDLRPASARQIEQQAGRATLLTAPQSTSQFLNLRIDRPPFSDPRVREAVRIGIDREALVRIVLLGTGQVGNDLFGGPDLQYYPSDAPRTTRDVERARALLREARATDTTVELQTSGSDPNFQPAANLVAEQLTEIGLRATPRVLDSATYFSAVRESGVASFTRTGTLPIPDFIGRRRLSSADNSNYTGYRSTEIDRLYAEAVADPDEDARAANLGRIQAMLRADSGALVWATSNWNVGIAAGVTGIAAAKPNSHLWGRFDRAAAG
ncbi:MULTISPECIES: ABC transporter substrate-binding protein [unclassified Pseudonocardia]|uniref:ABC transporter substrate-binding protein n=1 Tax=unclassified Pseudonocardia TaxID=2619320 RepID=UPI00094B473F|nr:MULTISPECIES: ABC transporter substrate-binding protein [unclassified Pseudonocardia]OLL74437.1 ABC transporter component, periplasmic oligopeptide binding protein [Pseudonocardia sp. Ae150A_Ps1]OLL85456.1 ABC transporter component, periplasmic oligopeptide binding protein [Pseudonocardia sp. Ae263_Ps1]